MALNLTKELAAWSRLPDMLGPYGYSHVDGVPVARDEVSAQAVIDAINVTDVQKYVTARIDAHAAALRDRIMAGVSAFEASSWPIKRAEAELYSMSHNETDAPLLSMEASARGVSLDEIVLRVARNAAALAGLEAVISGVAGRHKDALRTLGTISDVLGYDWHTGWPEV